MHTRYPRAAVEIDDTPTCGSQWDFGPPRSGAGTTRRAHPSSPPQTLWASQALPVLKGRVIGVRLRSGAVEVALVAAGADTLRWVDAGSALSEAQELQWLRVAQFRPTSR